MLAGLLVAPSVSAFYTYHTTEQRRWALPAAGGTPAPCPVGPGPTDALADLVDDVPLVGGLLADELRTAPRCAVAGVVQCGSGGAFGSAGGVCFDTLIQLEDLVEVTVTADGGGVVPIALCIAPTPEDPPCRPEEADQGNVQLLFGDNELYTSSPYESACAYVYIMAEPGETWVQGAATLQLHSLYPPAPCNPPPVYPH